MIILARSFDVNDPLLFVLVGLIIAVVVAQSVFFMLKAIKRSKELGMDQKVIRKTITSSILFTIAPAVAVLVGVISLSQALGVAIPWLRLSVVGSLSYETVAAGTALNALGGSLGERVTSEDAFVTILWIMTSGIAIGIFLVPLLTKKIQSGVIKIENKDKKWGELLNTAMFLGMISAFVGYIFCDVYYLWNESARVNKGVSATSGLIPIIVFFTSGIVMIVLGLLSKKFKKRWITDYALPISLIAGMAVAIPLTMWLG